MKENNNSNEPLELHNKFEPFSTHNPSQQSLSNPTLTEKSQPPHSRLIRNHHNDTSSDSSLDSGPGSPHIEFESPFRNEIKSFMDPFFSETREPHGFNLSRTFREKFQDGLKMPLYDNSSSNSNPWGDFRSELSSFRSPFERFGSLSSRIKHLMEESFPEPTLPNVKNIEGSPQKEEHPKKREDVIEEEEEDVVQCVSRGFANLGNTCYMNSVLQCLINSDINRFILEGNHLIGNPDEHLLTDSFAQVLCNAFSRKVERQILLRSLYRLKFTIEKFAPIFKGYTQNDAHELYRLLIEKIHDELNDAPRKREPYSEFKPLRGTTSAREIAEQWIKYSSERDHSVIRDIFGGTLISEIICTNCNKVSYTFEDALDLSLNLPSSNGICSSDNRRITSLYTSLDEFVEAEPVEGYRCEHCKKIDTSMKKTTIWKAPEVLVVQLKRFVYDQNGELDVIKDKVSFPLDNLNIEYFMHGESNENRNSYKLYGIVNHAGNLDSGHYVSYIYNEGLGRWLEYNDNEVSTIIDEEIINYSQGSAGPYLLFYKRV